MTSDGWVGLALLAFFITAPVAVAGAYWTTKPLQPNAQPKTYTGINLAYRSSEDWLKVALATPDEGICSHCGTYGPFDHVSACYRGLQMCYWCAELERERTRLIVEPK